MLDTTRKFQAAMKSAAVHPDILCYTPLDKPAKITNTTLESTDPETPFLNINIFNINTEI